MSLGHDSRNFFLPGPAGRLEAILWTPAGPAKPVMAAVICHPHPLFGGTMHNKVVYQAAKSLDSLAMAVLRFNFRGAGKSEGVHDRGDGERGDVDAALDFLEAEFPLLPQLVAGFSFGGGLARRLQRCPRYAIDRAGNPREWDRFFLLVRLPQTETLCAGRERQVWSD
jgi:alpha/beta superfamily hydrolase